MNMVDTLDMLDPNWKEYDFQIRTVFHCRYSYADVVMYLKLNKDIQEVNT